MWGSFRANDAEHSVCSVCGACSGQEDIQRNRARVSERLALTRRPRFQQRLSSRFVSAILVVFVVFVLLWLALCLDGACFVGVLLGGVR